MEVSILIIIKMNISKQKTTVVCWMMVGFIKLFDEVFVVLW